MTPSKFLLSLILTVLSLLASAGAHAQSALETILKNKKITIAVPPDFPPYGSMGADFKIQGLDADMAHYIGAKLGVTVDLIPVTSANRIPYLQTKKASLVIATLGKNPDREKQIDFAAAGAKVSFKRTVTKNGKPYLSDTFVSNYRPWQAIYMRGTKE